MTTERPKIQAYLEPELYSRLQEWKFQQGIEKDSAAINQILLEYFDVPQETKIDKYLDARIEEYFKQRDLELAGELAGIVARLDRIEDLVNVKDGVPTLFQEALETVQMQTYVIEELLSESPRTELSQTELANRLKIHKSTISHRKEKAGFAEWSKRHDPEGLAWQYDSDKNLFINLAKNS